MEIINLSDYDLVKAITRTEAKAVHKDLPPGGVWRTIKGHHIYIKDGKVLAGSIPGVTKAKKATKAQLAEHQEHINKEAKKNGSTGAKKATSTTKAKPKATKKATTGKTASTKGAKVDDKNVPTKSKTTTTGRKRSTTAKPKPSTAGKTSTATKKPGATKTGTKAPSKSEVTKTKGAVKGEAKTTQKAPATTAKNTKSAGARKPVSSTKKAATKSPAKGKTTKAGVKDIRTEAQKNRELAYDVGDKVGGARKDDFEASFKLKPTLAVLAKLEKESPALAEKLVTKAHLLPKFDFEAEHKNGVDLPTAILKKLLQDRIDLKPSERTPEARKAYMTAVQKFQRHFAGIKTIDNMQNAIREFSDLARKGKQGLVADRTLESYKANPTRWSYFNEELYKENSKKGAEARAMMDFTPLGSKFEGFFTDYKKRESTINTVKKNMKEGWDKYLNPKKTAPKAPKGGENKKWERKAEAEDLRTGGKKIKMDKPEQLVKEFNLRGVEFGHWVNDASGKYHLQRSAEAFSDLAGVLGIDPKDISLNGRLAIAFGARGKGTALAHYEPDRKVINMTKYGGAGSLAHEWGHAMDNILYQYSHGGQESLGLASDDIHDMGDNDPKLKALYQNVMDAITKPQPGDPGATKTITLDSSAKQPSHYYPRMRREVEEGTMTPQEIYQNWTKDINEKTDRQIARIRENRLGFYKTPEAIEKEVKKVEGQRNRELNKIGSMVAYEYKRDRNEDVKIEVKLPTGNSEYYQRMLETQTGKTQNGSHYWSQGCEMFARVFESYVQDKLKKNGQYNNYLVHGTAEGNVKVEGAPFPLGKERQAMFKAMDNLMKYISSKKTLKKAIMLEILASGRGDMTEELRKSVPGMKTVSLNDLLSSIHYNNLNAQFRQNRSAYNVMHPEEVIYIPINRLKTPYQTEQATNWDKVDSNYERMRLGENLEPVVIGFDYDIQDGHHRYEASHLMDYTHVPCVVMNTHDEIGRQRAIEGYKELWKSFDKSKHPRDTKGMFTKVYHTTKDKNFRFDPNYKNSGQEFGTGLYTAPAKDVEYWHRALQDPATGDRHPYVIPMDISEAKLINTHDIPDMAGRQEAILEHFGDDGDKAVEALDKEEKEHVTGETFNLRPHEVAEYRLYAKAKGYDGLIHEDEKEGHQIVLFDDSKVKYEPAMDVYDMLKKHRWGEL